MTSLLEIRLPDEVMQSLPGDKPAMLECLTKHFEQVVEAYQVRFQKRVPGALGEPLSRYEKSMLMDFLLEFTLGELRQHLRTDPPIAAAR